MTSSIISIYINYITDISLWTETKTKTIQTIHAVIFEKASLFSCNDLTCMNNCKSPSPWHFRPASLRHITSTLRARSPPKFAPCLQITSFKSTSVFFSNKCMTAVEKLCIEILFMYCTERPISSTQLHICIIGPNKEWKVHRYDLISASLEGPCSEINSLVGMSFPPSYVGYFILKSFTMHHSNSIFICYFSTKMHQSMTVGRQV